MKRRRLAKCDWVVVRSCAAPYEASDEILRREVATGGDPKPTQQSQPERAFHIVICTLPEGYDHDQRPPMNHQQLRLSQVITTYGPGSIIARREASTAPPANFRCSDI